MLSPNSYNSEHERGGGVLLLERQQQNSPYDALALFQSLFSSIVLNGFCPPLQEEENLNRDDKEKQKAAEEGRQLTNSFVNNPTRSIVDDRQESKSATAKAQKQQQKKQKDRSHRRRHQRESRQRQPQNMPSSTTFSGKQNSTNIIVGSPK